MRQTPSICCDFVQTFNPFTAVLAAPSFEKADYKNGEVLNPYGHSSGAVWESRWTSWAVRPNEPSGFRGRKDLLHRASALVTTCP